MNKYIIAIDGPSAAGKECLATQLSKFLGIVYIDTGAMYRSVGYYFINNNVDTDNDQEIEKALKNIDISFEFANDSLHTYLNGEDVSKKIRTEQIGLMASKVSAITSVRKSMVEKQREMGGKQSVILDGRDIGSVVFPNAEIKIFLTGDVTVRARRRYEQMIEKGENVSYEEILYNMKERDYFDIHKPISPLVQTEGSVLVDTTNLNRGEVLEKVKEILKERNII